MKPDARWLADIHAACFTVPRPWSRAEFSQLLQDRQIAIISSQTGFALGRAIADEAELMSIAVLPTARRQGMARDLMQRFEQLVSERGVTQIFLEVGADNAPAQSLYNACGFQQSARRAGYYRTADGGRIDALIFTKTITIR